MVAIRDWTREWWQQERGKYELVTSVAVLDELRQGDHPGQENKIRLLDSARLLPVVVETDSLVEAYLEHRLMPRNNLADARHLAVATYHRCDFLLTWNCRHLANGNKLRHLRKINKGLGLPSPDLVTPLELMEDSA